MTNPSTALIRGVDPARVNLTVLTAALKEAGLKFSAKTSVEERITLLADHELEAIGDDEARADADKLGGECDVCFGTSLLTRPACPFCGTGNDQPAADAPVTNPPPRSAKEAKSKAKAGKQADKQPEAEAAAKPTKKRGDVKKKVDTVEEPEATEAEAVEAPKSVVKAGSGKLTKTQIGELDVIERRIKGLYQDGLSNLWQVGKSLKEAMDKGLWKRRVNDDGSLVHGTFAAWCSRVFEISPTYARTLMAVANNFSEQQVRQLGPTKLDLTLKLPKGLREEMVAKASELSIRELDTEVRKLGGVSKERVENPDEKGARPSVAEANRKRAGEKRPRAARPVADNEVTAVIQLKQYELPLFARAKSAETGAHVRAKTVSADPHAALDLMNGVRLYVKIVEDDEGLVALLEYARVDSETEAQAE